MQATLPLSDYLRYGRQMILDGIGLPGQLKLQQAYVAVVGAGGLGCPALQYLAAAGVGNICIVDHDSVELSNLSRQILHTNERIGMNKAQSAAAALQAINPSCNVIVHTRALTVENAISILKPADVILDCTDNAPTRYLLSDTAVKLGKPLVSGAAQKFEGQLCIYNFGQDGPCYRCLFPRPPSPEVTGSCAEVGILGVVTGIIGNMQALETIKILLGLHEGKSTLLLFSALSLQPFRTIKLRSRSSTCPACGTDAAQKDLIADTDYVTFCGGQRPDWIHLGMQGSNDDIRRIKASELQRAIQSGKPIRILDVRPRTEFGICHIPGSKNVPLGELVADPGSHSTADEETYLVCRLGNDSQIAAEALRNTGTVGAVKDLVGGLRAWAADVDRQFPVY